MVGVDRAEASRIAHRRHPIAAPITPANARELLGWLSPPPGGQVLDLGCGEGEWLLTLLAEHPDVKAVGVDVSASALDLARISAERRGLDGRTTWIAGDAATWKDGLYDVVLCVGATHAFGGLDKTLDAVRAHLRPGGQAVVGDGFWEVAPSGAALDALDAVPGDFPDLPGLVQRAREHGFEPGYGHVSTLAEWDEYEWSWTASLTEWALREAPDEQQRQEALAIAGEHRSGWLGGYRGVLGFATLVLHHG
jgi:SAM-dependent methyltransferase